MNFILNWLSADSRGLKDFARAAVMSRRLAYLLSLVLGLALPDGYSGLASVGGTPTAPLKRVTIHIFGCGGVVSGFLGFEGLCCGAC